MEMENEFRCANRQCYHVCRRQCRGCRLRCVGTFSFLFSPRHSDYHSNQPPCDTISYNSTLKIAHRIYFYSLIPPVGTPQQSDDIFQPPIPHPEATLPYVEVLVPAKHHMHHIELQLGQDGKVGLLLVSADTTRQNFVGLWDWKAGVSIGVSLYCSPSRQQLTCGRNFLLPPTSLCVKISASWAPSFFPLL